MDMMNRGQIFQESERHVLREPAAGRVMIWQNGGRITNVSSQAGFVALPAESVYCMTKAAIVHLTRCLAVEWGKYNITVNAVAPTFLETPGTEACLADAAFRADVNGSPCCTASASPWTPRARLSSLLPRRLL
jgi:NAD(P)-dependent dehydrogenase (short-subunit alcohol dehydrogenase family)